MGFDQNNSNAVNGRVVIDLCAADGDVTIDHLDVNVNDEIDFEVRERIEDIDDDVLDDFTGHSLKPAEIHLCTQQTST